MGFLGFGKKDKVVDLSERYKRQQEQAAQIKAESSEEDSQVSPFGIFDSPAASTDPAESGGYIDVSSNIEEKRRKLTKRLTDMTTQMENLSNQIYHLQQRIELIERKLDVNRSE